MAGKKSEGNGEKEAWAWKVQAEAIESVQKRVDGFDAEIERLTKGISSVDQALVKSNNHRELFETKARGQLMILEKKVLTASRRSNLNLNILNRFHKEMWFWSVTMAVSCGLVIGLSLALLNPVVTKDITIKIVPTVEQ